jgi:Amt family ammonium transporter
MDPTTNGADPTLPLQAYNGTVATGGDSRVENLNVYYNVSFARLVCSFRTWG